MKSADILLTGGTGKTGRRIADRLEALGQDFRVASRSGTAEKGRNGVHFDWSDAGTFPQALRGVSTVYLVTPHIADPLSLMRPFLEMALSGGTTRFVLLSSSAIEEGEPFMGQVHAWLKRFVPEWTVLRPSWFMQNFSEQQHLPTIRDEGCIYSATANGRVSFIDAGDIAAVAAKALTRSEPLNRDMILTGPEALSYDDVADIIGRTIGRKIEHVRLTGEELARRCIELGLNERLAETLVAMDTAIAQGTEDRTTDEVQAITGHAPKDFSTFARDSKAVWLPQTG